MSKPDASTIVVSTGTSDRPVALDDIVSGDIAEHAEADANAWIKRLRHARIDGQSFRDRFTVRGDSLWWFAELYLHKRRIVTRAFRALRALEHLATERPASWTVDGRDQVLSHIAHLVAERRGFPCRGPRDHRPRTGRLERELKAVFHTATALADRLRPARAPRTDRPVVAAFVHSAFARGAAEDEAYVGPVLRELRDRLKGDALHLVGLGPRTNFRVRRWRDRVREFADPAARGLALTPIDAYAGWRDLEPSLGQWRARADVARALRASTDLCAAAIVNGYDLWRLLAPELDGIADLQFPWSARAMDEAGAALDRLQPRAIVTYAEAGGWGRALVLEARRRAIPVVALQHGFIYRHWLNYLHEVDEMAPSAGNAGDRGFPLPDRTLVFDAFAREHLEQLAVFPARPSPSPEARASMPRDGGEPNRRECATRHVDPPLGVDTASAIVVVATKYTQIAPAFGALVDAVGRHAGRRARRQAASCRGRWALRRRRCSGVGRRPDGAAGTAARGADGGRRPRSSPSIRRPRSRRCRWAFRRWSSNCPTISARSWTPGSWRAARPTADRAGSASACCMMKGCAAGWPRPVARLSPATASTPTAGPHGERPTSFSSSPDTEFRARVHHRRGRVHRVAPGRGSARLRPRGVDSRRPLDRVDRQHRAPQGPSRASATRSTA